MVGEQYSTGNVPSRNCCSRSTRSSLCTCARVLTRTQPGQRRGEVGVYSVRKNGFTRDRVGLHLHPYRVLDTRRAVSGPPQNRRGLELIARVVSP